LSELTPQLANERNLKGVRGLLVQEVDPSGIAFDAGVTKNMVIERINRAPVSTTQDFERIVGGLKPGDPVVLHVASNDGDRVRHSIVQFTFQ
jgi:S1-C subfamily serine protease